MVRLRAETLEKIQASLRPGESVAGVIRAATEAAVAERDTDGA